MRCGARRCCSHATTRSTRCGRSSTRSWPSGSGRVDRSRSMRPARRAGRTTLDAWASLHSDVELKEPGQLALTHEDLEVDIGRKHVLNLATIVDPLLVRDLITIVWSPHGHPEAVDTLLGLADVVLLDS